MKQLKLIAYVLMISALFVCCTKNKLEVPAAFADCVFDENSVCLIDIIDENERMIMNECRENSFSTKTRIQNNLIGEWALVGFGVGIWPTGPQPCTYLTITSSELTLEYKDKEIDTITTHSWEIEEINNGTSESFVLRVDSQNIGGITVFCDDYMFHDSTDSDGEMRLYQKVN